MRGTGGYVKGRNCSVESEGLVKWGKARRRGAGADRYYLQALERARRPAGCRSTQRWATRVDVVGRALVCINPLNSRLPSPLLPSHSPIHLAPFPAQKLYEDVQWGKFADQFDDDDDEDEDDE
jgi:hypothetical protein